MQFIALVETTSVVQALRPTFITRTKLSVVMCALLASLLFVLCLQSSQGRWVKVHLVGRVQRVRDGAAQQTELMNVSESIAAGSPDSMFDTMDVTGAGSSFECISSLVLVVLVLYALQFLIKTVNQWFSQQQNKDGLKDVLRAGCTTITHAPVLCVLFLGARMRGILLAQSDAEKHQLPLPLVQKAMFTCTYAVVAQVVLSMVMPLFIRGTTTEIGTYERSSGRKLFELLSVAHYLSMIGLYGGFTITMIRAFTKQSPKDLLGFDLAPVAPTVIGALVLAITFFLIYFLVAITRAVAVVRSRVGKLIKLIGVLTMAKYTLNFASLLCIIFTATRMRAFQMDPVHDHPQEWAQYCFYVCVFSVLIRGFLVLLVPCFADCECQQGMCEGDIIFKMANSCAGTLMSVIRCLLLLGQYGGFVGVVFSIISMQQPASTSAASDTIFCVLTMVVQYYFIYLMLLMCASLMQFSASNPRPECYIEMWQDAQRMVVLVPMLSMAFVAADMQRLELTRSTGWAIPAEGAPLAPYEDIMLITTYSLIVQLTVGVFSRVVLKPRLTPFGLKKSPAKRMQECGVLAMKLASQIMLFFAYGIMYICSMMLVLGIVAMIPETPVLHGKHPAYIQSYL